MAEELATAIDDYAGAVAARLDDYVHRLGMGDETLATREYRRMLGVVDALEARIDEALAEDRADFDRFLSRLQAIAFSQAAAAGERSRIESPTIDVAADTRALLARVRERVEQAVLVHVDVPEELAEAAQEWGRAAEAARSVEGLLATTRDVGEWRGEAAHVYRVMADVQRGAGQEYVHLPQAMSDAYDVLGTLNRAVLVAVHAALETTLLAARCCPTPGAFDFFSRLAHCHDELRRLADERLPAALDIAGDGIGEVTQAVDECRTSTRLLATRWPTGTGAAGAPPGDTAAPTLAAMRWR